MRFTLCKLFLGVTMAALASAGMTLHTPLWAEAIVSFSIVLYTAVAILAFRRGGDSRAFRSTFAVVGAGYLLLTLCNLFSPIRDLLITHRSLVSAGRALQVPTQQPPANYTPGSLYSNPVYGAPTSNGTVNFTTAGTGTLTLSGATTIYTVPQVADEWDNLLGFGIPVLNPRIPAGAFLIVGHCVWSWLLALAAGCFAAFVNRPRVLASQ